MGKKKIRGKDLIRLGFEQGPVISMVLEVIKKEFKYHTNDEVFELLSAVVAEPEAFLNDGPFAKIAGLLVPSKEPEINRVSLNPAKIPYPIYGEEHIDEGTKEQMNVAMRLPITKAGALMADAHRGYGLPIGGVLAVDNAVIPYAVGLDIGCRMCLSIYPIDPGILNNKPDQFKKALLDNTRFGKETFERPMDDPIFSNPAFKTFPKLKKLKGKAWSQIGSSGSGNHFVEFGAVSIADYDPILKVEAGEYLAVLSHSGSRGFGAQIAQHYTALAMEERRLPKDAKQLAWLDLNSEAGQEYWIAMNLAGDYASACHRQIHQRMVDFLGESELAIVENHHNFAWKENIQGNDYIIHRKGATPAAKDELGVIPGSMTAPAYIVKGRGKPEALNSASHGAGRLMSRRRAKASTTQSALKKLLSTKKVTLIGGGLDEAPHAYKDIGQVMAAQGDLVDILGSFQPRIVRMDRPSKR